MFGWINRRCQRATGLTTLPFGGISIIIVGDIAQLPPITDQVLYHNKPKSDVAVEGYCMYRKFDTVVKLQVNERARGNDREQENFRQLQMQLRNGDSTLEDWKVLLQRARLRQNLPARMEFTCCICLAPLEDGQPIVVLTAKGSDSIN